MGMSGPLRPAMSSLKVDVMDFKVGIEFTVVTLMGPVSVVVAASAAAG